MAVDQSVRLAIYNDALILLGERTLSSLSENREPLRLLDAVWDGAIRYCLEEGQWNFAVRGTKIEYDPSVEPPFGYERAFPKPDDWVRTCSVCTDPYFNNALESYIDEAGFWFANHSDLFVRFVSDDDLYGLNSSAWPQTYRRFVAAYLAKLLSPRLKNGSDAQIVEQEFRMRKSDALTKDAMQDPVKHVPAGYFVQSRRGHRGQFNR
ncbi:hypothetical protein [Kosakonia radicincitans]|uniref:hypothetical protein n=1 Tax=Kosakonia radicincitans TaxID=283686 RepID=UPI001D091D5C|nr:hypothetical protein [Kosakonia radicincitans]